MGQKTGKGESPMALLHVGASPAVLLDCGLHNHDCYEIIVNTEGEVWPKSAGRKSPSLRARSM